MISTCPHEDRPALPANSHFGWNTSNKSKKNASKIKPGYRSGRWTVTGFIDDEGKLPVVCECGTNHALSEAVLLARSSHECNSCRTRNSSRFTLCEIMGDETYGILQGRWSSMKGRCENPKDKDYPNYGGRGISCQFPDFEHFAGYMYFALGFHAGCGLEIDRIDNDGPYAPWNIQLASRAEQNVNRRSTVWLVVEGQRIHGAEFHRKYLGTAMSTTRLYELIAAGCSADEILDFAYRDGRPADAVLPEEDDPSLDELLSAACTEDPTLARILS